MLCDYRTDILSHLKEPRGQHFKCPREQDDEPGQ